MGVVDAGLRGVRSGGGGGGEKEEGAGLGSLAASAGSVAGELRGGELERVRGRVADLGAAIETSQVCIYDADHIDEILKLIHWGGGVMFVCWSHAVGSPFCPELTI